MGVAMDEGSKAWLSLFQGSWLPLSQIWDKKEDGWMKAISVKHLNFFKEKSNLVLIYSQLNFYMLIF